MAWGSDGWSSQSNTAVTLTAPVISNLRPSSSLNTVFNVVNGGSTYSNNMVVVGTSIYSAATITVYRGGVSQGTTTTDGTGFWSFALGILPDATYSITALVTVGAQTSAQSTALSFTVAPSVTGVSIGVNLNDSVDFTYTGQMWSAQNDSTNPSALVALDTHTLAFSCRPADRWPGDGTNRSEIQNFNDKIAGTTFNWTWEFWMDPADPVNNAGVSIPNGGLDGTLVVGQLWSPGGPSLALVMGDNTLGDCLGTMYFSPSQVWLFTTGNLSRGVWHQMDVIGKPASSGAILQVYVDSVLIQSSSAFVDPSADQSHYNIQFGYYRHPTVGNTQTQHVRYRNTLLVYT